MNVKSWLRRVPQPSSVRLDRKKLVRVGEGKTRWKEVLDVVLLEQPSVIEALDSDGAVIRMTELASESGDDEKPEAPPKLTGEYALLERFAVLIAEAYERGATAHAKAYELAFGENTKLVTALSTQSRHLQGALEAQLEARLLAAEQGTDGGDLMNGPLAPLIQGLAAKMLTEKATTVSSKSNGKKA